MWKCWERKELERGCWLRPTEEQETDNHRKAEYLPTIISQAANHTSNIRENQHLILIHIIQFGFSVSLLKRLQVKWATHYVEESLNQLAFKLNDWKHDFCWNSHSNQVNSITVNLSDCSSFTTRPVTLNTTSLPPRTLLPPQDSSHENIFYQDLISATVFLQMCSV